MTPKQRMAARKRAEADLRLQQMKAHMDIHNFSDRKHQAHSRKSHMIRGSLHGGGATVSPGSVQACEPGAQGPRTPPRLLIELEIPNGPPAVQAFDPYQASAHSGRSGEPLPGGGLAPMERDTSTGPRSALLVLARWFQDPSESC